MHVLFIYYTTLLNKLSLLSLVNEELSLSLSLSLALTFCLSCFPPPLSLPPPPVLMRISVRLCASWICTGGVEGWRGRRGEVTFWGQTNLLPLYLLLRACAEPHTKRWFSRDVSCYHGSVWNSQAGGYVLTCHTKVARDSSDTIFSSGTFFSFPALLHSRAAVAGAGWDWLSVGVSRGGSWGGFYFQNLSSLFMGDSSLVYQPDRMSGVACVKTTPPYAGHDVYVDVLASHPHDSTIHRWLNHHLEHLLLPQFRLQVCLQLNLVVSMCEEESAGKLNFCI